MILNFLRCDIIIQKIGDEIVTRIITGVKVSEENQKLFNDADRLKTFLLNCDSERAGLDPYDENILFDPNRGHWDLWDFDQEGGKEIPLEENFVARDPADDVSTGIVAIDFGTSRTVVIYENEHSQFLPLQVGSGSYRQGINFSANYENPTLIQFIDIESFLTAYYWREGRPFTKWSDVKVSHAAFENMISGGSEKFYSFLTDLKYWCGSKTQFMLRDEKKFITQLAPFSELAEDEINPLEIYAYYLGVFINNMQQEKHIFLNYILSFPVTYDKTIREKMRLCFERGLKKSLPTALLSNETVMKKFSVREGASEAAAYAITALQEYGFDPSGEEEIYYAVFDIGGGTTDFDFGFLRESPNDRYDYLLVHFGENGDRTLGGENHLKLLAFEVFKANQDRLINIEGGGKIPFTWAADKKSFADSEALIKDSQEAHANMHALVEKLRPVWEAPESDAAQEILAGGFIEVNLFRDDGKLIKNFSLDAAIDLQGILRERIKAGIKNFFISMKENAQLKCIIYEALQKHKEIAMVSNENFPRLVHLYKDMIFRLAYSYTKNHFDADDITQNVLLQLYKGDKDFKSDAHIKNWLIRVTVNHCKNLFRAPWRKNENLEDYANTLVFEEESSRDLFCTVMGLDKKYRVTLLLYYYEGYSIREIAHIMEIPEKTVSTRLARGRKILKELLLEVE